MKTTKLMFFALSVGEVMLKSGAETYRVEDSIDRILMTSGYSGITSFVTPTGLFASIDDPENDHITYIRRVKRREIHLHKIEEANRISRQYCDGSIDLDEALGQIKEVDEMKSYPFTTKVASTSLAAALFVLVLGGTITDMLITLLAGIALSVLMIFLVRGSNSKFFIDIVGAGLTTSIVLVFYRVLGLGHNLDLMIISSIMPLVPGVAITNAVRDTIHGDLVSGSARILDAFIVAASIATGVGISLSVFSSWLGGVIV